MDCHLFLRVCDAAVGDGKLVDVFLSPDGEVKSQAGDFVVDDAAWRRIENAFKARKLPLVIDWEHQTLGGQFARSDGTAPAAGWIVSLRREEGRGIIASVDWTERARDAIRSGEYKYISPVMVVRKKDGAVEALHSAGLTNDPAITERMEKLAASARKSIKENRHMAEQPQPTDGGEEDPGIIIGMILAELGITESAGSNIANLKAIHEAVKKKPGDKEGDESKPGESGGESEEVASSVRATLQLSKDATAETVKTALETIVNTARIAGDTAKKVAGLQEELRVNRREAFLKPYEDKGVLDREGDEAFFKVVCRAYDNDPADAKVLLDPRVDALPPGGKIVSHSDQTQASGGREAVIAHSSREFDSEKMLQNMTGKAAYVNQSLSEEKHAALTDKETEALLV